MLRFGVREKNPQAAQRDFRLFTPEFIDTQTWLDPDLRHRWLAYWAETKSSSILSASQ